MLAPHAPVLKKEVLSVFHDIQDGIIIDCTLGYGGHSEAILTQNSKIKLIACDRDDEAIVFSRQRLAKFDGRVEIHKCKFSEILDLVDTTQIRGILADIGLSSLHLDKNERGFSIKSDELDMRMDKTQDKDAKFVVNHYGVTELENIFKKYGELYNAQNLAQKIVATRAKSEITSAKELAKIIGTKPIKNRSITPATLAFQAIRIEVNDELNELEQLLSKIEHSNISHAKIAIISFHSLEDRIVKNKFKEWAKSCICSDLAMRCECGNNHSIGKNLAKNITATQDEIKENSRSSCAKMRVFEINRE